MSEGGEEGGAQAQAEVRRRGADYVILLRSDSSTGSRVRGCQVPVLRPWLLQGLRSSLRLQLRSSCHPNMDSASQGTSRRAWAASHSGSRGSAPRSSQPLRVRFTASPADRPLTSRLLMVVVWVLSCHGAWASPGIALKRPSSAPCRFLEFANSRHSPCASRHLRPSIFRRAPGNTPSGVGL